MTYTLPEWASEAILQIEKYRRTGSVRLNFSDGGLRNVEQVQTVFPPKERLQYEQQVRKRET
jgi:hypothetical protein